MSSMLFSLCLLLAASSTQAIVVENTAGKTYLGFTFDDVDATDYRNLTIDISQIMTAITVKPRNYADADAIYRAGRNAKRSSGALRILKSITTAVRVNELYYTTYTSFYGVNFTEKFMGSSIEPSSVPEKVLTGLQWVLVGYIGHELDVTRNTIITNPTVAALEVQDSFGIWLGYAELPGLYNHFRSIEQRLSCGGQLLTTRVAKCFKKMLAAAKAQDALAFNTQYDEMFKKVFVATYLRSVMYASGLKKRNIASQRLALGYLKTIQPLLVKTNAAEKLAKLLDSSKVAQPSQVEAYVKQIADKQMVTRKDAGICPKKG